jgi:hypothetical protein
MIPKIARWVGIALFVISFFLPAVGGGGGGGWGFSDQLPGWLCALYSLMAISWSLISMPSSILALIQGHAGSQEMPHEWFKSLALSGAGLVVPMVLIYLLLCLRGQGTKLLLSRRVVASVILAGVIGAWCFLLLPNSPPDHDQLTPMIGHFLWTLGIVLILAPEIIPV